jgi:glycosyltransferase involved in cell wall biosynthesis
MKILIVHNAYQQSGGEDAVVDAELALLREHGHTVQAYRRHNQELLEHPGMATAAGALWSRRATREIELLINGKAPDLIHVHNTFPLISPAFFWMAARRKIPLVQTLHNFRLLCPQAMLLRESKVCMDCVGKLPWRAITRRCYRDSSSQSAVVASMLGVHRLLGTYQKRVTQFIALNTFCRDKFIAGGLPPERLRIKPHFVQPPPINASPRRGAMFVGRMAPEKGLALLADSMPADLREGLRIVGSGPLEAMVRERFGHAFLGARTHDEIMRMLQGAAFLVAPSISYETFGMNVVEAFACATPVIASGHGAYAELISDGMTGLLFTPGDAQELGDKIRWALANPVAMRRMGIAARIEYEARYTPQRNYQLMMDIYEHAIRSKHRELNGA